MTEKKKCANAACDCVPADDSKYCSAYCEGEEDNTSIVCRCGHASCDGDVTTADNEESIIASPDELSAGGYEIAR